MIKKIDLFRPYSSQYGALYHFTEKLYEAWIRAGYQARYFTDVDAGLNVCLEDPPDLMIGFNGVPKKNGQFYCDLIQRPYLTILVDPFYRFLDVTSSPYVIIGCEDFSSVVSLKKLQFDNTILVPHAVESNLTFDSAQERIYDVSLLATFIDYESRRKEWNTTYPKLICKAMDKIVDLTFNSSITFIDATWTQLQLLYQKHPELKAIDVDTWSIFRDIELYLKGKERVALLESIQNVPVHVFGETVDSVNWKTFFQNQPNIIVHPSVSYEESLEIAKKSKIVLNTSIKNKFGAHERIFSGLAAGALTFTNENAYLKQFFTHDIDIAFFQNNQLSLLEPLIKTYLSNEKKRQEMVENGREITLSFHTWDARIKNFEKELFPLVEKIQGLKHM